MEEIDDGLVPPDESTLLAYKQSNLLRLCFRDPLFSRLSLWPFAACFFDSSKQTGITTRQSANRQVWLHGKAVPLQDSIQQPINLRSYIIGKNIFMNSIWPVITLTLLTKDLYTLSGNIALQYYTSVAQVLGGFGDSEYFYLSNLRPLSATLVGKYLTLGALVGAPVLLGLLNVVLHGRWGKSIKATDEQEFVEFLQRASRENSLLHVLVGSKFSRQLDKAILRLLWTDEFAHDPITIQLGKPDSIELIEQSLVKCIETLLAKGSTLTRLVVLRAVCAMIDQLPNNIEGERKPLLSNNTHADDRHHLKLRMLKAVVLQTNMNKTSRFITVLYANYLLWTIGIFPNRYHENMTESQRRMRLFLQALFFMPFDIVKQSILLFARYHYYRLLIVQLIEITQTTNMDVGTCDDPREIVSRRPETESYECGLCSDWPFVYIEDINNAQSCLTGLLSTPQEAAFINQKLAQLLVRGDANTTISTVDLSSQDWSNWRDEDFEQMVDLLKMTASSLQELELVSKAGNNKPLSSSKLASIAQLLKAHDLKTLILDNIALDSTSLTALLTALNPSSRLQTLSLSGCGLLDDSMQSLASFFPSFSLSQLNVAQNQFGQAGLNALAHIVSGTPLVTLDCHDNNFANLDITQFAASLNSTSLQSVNLSGCQLGDLNIAILAPAIASSELITIDLSGNALSPQGNLFLIGQLASSKIRQFSFRAAGLSNDGLAQLGSSLTQWLLQTLDISDNNFRESAFDQFALQLVNATLQQLVCKDNFLSSHSAQTLAQHIRQYQQLIALDLSSNNIPDDAAAILIQAVQHTSLRALRLSSNGLSTASVDALVALLLNRTITELDISGNAISGSDALKIINALPKSALENLNFASNPIGDQGGTALACALITPSISPQVLGQAQLPKEIIRRIVNARAASALRTVSLENIGASDQSAFALCHTLFRSGINLRRVNLKNNRKINPSRVDITNCRINTTAANSISAVRGLLSSPYQVDSGASSSPINHGVSLLGLMVPIFGLLVFCILIYQSIKHCRHKKTKSNEESYPQLAKGVQ